LCGGFKVIAIHKGEIVEPVSVKWFMGRSRNASTVHAVLHATTADRKKWMHATGTAGGYGYCRMSGAIQSAITRAGIELFGSPYAPRNPDEKPDYRQRADIGGVGEMAVREALLAIARACGYRKITIIQF
jgi:hypothetical protein